MIIVAVFICIITGAFIFKLHLKVVTGHSELILALFYLLVFILCFILCIYSL